MLYLYNVLSLSNKFTWNKSSENTRIFHPYYEGHPISMYGFKGEFNIDNLGFRYNSTNNGDFFANGIRIRSNIITPQDENSLYLEISFESNFTSFKRVKFALYGEAPFSENDYTNFSLFAGNKEYIYRDSISNKRMIITADDTGTNYYFLTHSKEHFIESNFDMIHNFRQGWPDRAGNWDIIPFASNISPWAFIFHIDLEPFQSETIKFKLTDDSFIEPTPKLSLFDNNVLYYGEQFSLLVTTSLSNTTYFIENAIYIYEKIATFVSSQANYSERVYATFPSSTFNNAVYRLVVHSQFSMNSEPIYVMFERKTNAELSANITNVNPYALSNEIYFHFQSPITYGFIPSLIIDNDTNNIIFS